MAYCLPTCPKFCWNLFCPQPVRIIALLLSCPTHCCASQHFSTMEQSQSIQELCPTICSSQCLPSCPFFVGRCLCPCQAQVQAVALWAAFRHVNNIVVKSAILLIFWHSHLPFLHGNLQFTVTTCARHTVVLPHPNNCHFQQIFNINRKCPTKFLLPQSYATPTPYAPVFARCTVHTVGPVLLHRATKVSIPIQNPGTNITSWKVSCGSKSLL